jgi:hypothetical protein
VAYRAAQLALRELGKLINRPKSNVHRHRQAQLRRNLHPESGLWETEAGEAWLRLLMFAVLHKFGLQHVAGADALSDFLKLIRIDTHVGVSPSALRTQLSKMEALMLTFQHSCEQSAPAQTRKVVLAADETFFGEVMILVLMDLSSGYLLLESIQDDRRFDTWLAQASPRLDALGIEVGHAVSDRAKALIKLAVEGFDCASGSDVFHEQYGLSRWLGSALGRRKARADKLCEATQKVTNKARVDEKEALETQQAHAIETRTQVDKAQQDYHENLLGISDDLHPFSLKTTPAIRWIL